MQNQVPAKVDNAAASPTVQFLLEKRCWDFLCHSTSLSLLSCLAPSGRSVHIHTKKPVSLLCVVSKGNFTHFIYYFYVHKKICHIKLSSWDVPETNHLDFHI